MKELARLIALRDELGTRDLAEALGIPAPSLRRAISTKKVGPSIRQALAELDISGGDSFQDELNEFLGNEFLGNEPDTDEDFEADLDSNFSEYDWDEIASEYDDIDVFEWFSELS